VVVEELVVVVALVSQRRTMSSTVFADGGVLVVVDEEVVVEVVVVPSPAKKCINHEPIICDPYRGIRKILTAALVVRVFTIALTLEAPLTSKTYRGLT